ncbi:exopolysaccharide biosynthesis protein EpsL [Massilia horti]|uniref:Exopolysaccharide biosynthesis protein EpsL n=1 Tax=Massilia horti TaxID=2562153 RepID=A0A4Y9T5F2_9BURK|nr:exopolysaccharide biosynthesis protein EpsL [Massilia horti]
MALLIGAFCSAAWAGPNDALHVYGGVGLAHDDNLLRVPDNQPAFDNTRGDWWKMAEVGLLFDKTYSRQRIEAVAKLSKVKFNHFKQLDYDGKDAQATWHWQLGNHLEGKLGALYNQVLAPYTDFHSSERNLRTERKEFFDGAWRFHPSWRARAGASTDKYTYEASSQRFNDRTEDTYELEGDYLPASGSTVGLVLRKIKGRYPNRRPIGQVFVTDDFTQNEVKARVRWLATGATEIEALAGWARRDQPSFGAPTSGFNGRVGASYKPRGKVRYNAALWRDFAPIESSLVSYTLNKGASIGASWEATGKITVDANAIYERRHYNARLALPSSGELTDAIRSASLQAKWAVRPAIQLSAGFVHQSRTGSVTLGTGSFKSNSIAFNASAQF